MVRADSPEIAQEFAGRVPMKFLTISRGRNASNSEADHEAEQSRTDQEGNRKIRCPAKHRHQKPRRSGPGHNH